MLRMVVCEGVVMVKEEVRDRTVKKMQSEREKCAIFVCVVQRKKGVRVSE